MRPHRLFICMFAVALSIVPPWRSAAADRAPAANDAFWAHWGDGKAEIATYDLSFTRYGEVRKGVAAAIFVTETFSDRLRVKADPGRHPASDEFPVMKLNLVQDFPTGIYDYNLMTSVFVALGRGKPAGLPVKASFSSQEWCGHVYHQLLFDETEIREELHSYFDGEADQQRRLTKPADGFSEDVMFHWARGLAVPVLGPGESIDVPFLPSLQTARLEHRPVEWTRASLARADTPRAVTVPAGTFDAEVYTASIQNGRTWTFYVETETPHRILRWETSDGQKAELIASERVAYWRHNGAGGESKLRELGLTPRPPRTP